MSVVPYYGRRHDREWEMKMIIERIQAEMLWIKIHKNEIMDAIGMTMFFVMLWGFMFIFD